jgi:hypothetical protein
LGDRAEGDEVDYPDVDLAAGHTTDGKRCFAHKDVRP